MSENTQESNEQEEDIYDAVSQYRKDHPQQESVPKDVIYPGPYIQYLKNKQENIKALIVPMNSPSYFIGCNTSNLGKLEMLQELINDIKQKQ